MIDWNKRNGGFLAPESVYEDQLNNLSMQINQKDKEIERLNKNIKRIQYMLCDAHTLADEYIEKYNRLNNIINKLEKDLLKKQEFYRNELSTRPTNDSEHNTRFADSCALAQIDVILDKLKELKESK